MQTQIWLVGRQVAFYRLPRNGLLSFLAYGFTALDTGYRTTISPQSYKAY